MGELVRATAANHRESPARDPTRAEPPGAADEGEGKERAEHLPPFEPACRAGRTRDARVRRTSLPCVRPPRDRAGPHRSTPCSGVSRATSRCAHRGGLRARAAGSTDEGMRVVGAGVFVRLRGRGRRRGGLGTALGPSRPGLPGGDGWPHDHQARRRRAAAHVRPVRVAGAGRDRGAVRAHARGALPSLGGRHVRRRALRSRRGRRHGSGAGRRARRHLSGSRLGRGSRCGRRRGCRRRVGGIPRRKERQGVDVLVLPDAHAEVDVRDVVLELARRPGLGNRVTLGYPRALPDEERAEVGERRAVAVAGRDRDREPMRRNRARERHLAGRRRADRRAPEDLDVDPAMLAGGVPVVADGECPEHRSVGGPPPRVRVPGHDERGCGPCRQSERASRCPPSEHAPTVAPPRPPGNRS